MADDTGYQDEVLRSEEDRRNKKDRRCSTKPYNGPERRSDTDRRQQGDSADSTKST